MHKMHELPHETTGPQIALPREVQEFHDELCVRIARTPLLGLALPAIYRDVLAMTFGANEERIQRACDALAKAAVTRARAIRASADGEAGRDD